MLEHHRGDRARDPIRDERATLCGSNHARLALRCPGCELEHQVSVREGAGPLIWQWNDSLDRPTLSPSILVTYNGSDAGQDRGDGRRAPAAVCHSFVREGLIEFLGDCTHQLAGQTVELPRWAR